MRKNISDSQYYEEKDFQNRLVETILPLVEKKDFWWKEIMDFYIEYYQYRVKERKKFLYFSDIERILELPFFPLKAQDCAGNTLAQSLIDMSQQNASETHYKFMFFEDDIYQILDLTENSMDYNRAGENAFWRLNNIVFTLAQPAQKLTPLINKYNIDIFHKNAKGENLLDKAVYDKEDYRIEYYLAQGLTLSNPFSSFIFHRQLYRGGICGKLFKEQMQKYNIFTQKIKRNKLTDLSIIDLWLSFSGNSAHNYTKNLISVINYHVRECPAHVALEDIKNAFEKMEAIPELKKQLVSLRAEFEKKYLNINLQKNNSGAKTLKI